MRLLFCGTGWLSIVDLITARLPAGATITVRAPDRPLIEQVGEVDVLLPSNARIDAGVLDSATSLRLIQQPAAGFEGIDLQAAKARGVPVCNAPGQNAASVAETALLLMLSLARRLPEAHKSLSARIVGEPIGHELQGKVLGIIGMGRSGSQLARAARTLGMHVLGVRSSSTEAELDRLLGEADFVSIHCPLTDATRGLVGRRALSRMKRGACVINCARGGIVDREALLAALERGALGGVGLDVHWHEPPDPQDPLYRRPDVVALPHLGGSTWEALGRLADVVVDNVGRLQRGEPLQYRVA